MRRADGLAEKLAWVLLRDRRMLGLKFRRQVPIENFIVDFYCHELRLIIELDGGVHDQPSQEMKKDTRRNVRLRKLGYQLLRVPNGIVMKDPAAPSPAASRHPLPEGEGQTSGSVPS